MLENTIGVCLSSLKCKSHPPKQIYVLWRKHSKGEGHDSHTWDIYTGNMFVLWERAFSFEVGYQFSPINITYNCVHGVIFRQISTSGHLMINCVCSDSSNTAVFKSSFIFKVPVRNK